MIQPSRGRARIGILVPFTNTNLEPDMALMRPHGVSLHAARLGGYDADEIPDETQMQALGASALDEPLRLLAGVRPDVVLYGCTSATLTHGVAFDRALADQIRAMGKAETVTAAGALVHALTTLGARRVAFASPYVPAINDMAIDFLETSGFAVVGRADVTGTLDNDGQGAMPPDAVYALGRRADVPEADVVVMSCTDMQSVSVLQSLEDAIGKPVISSNQAMMFQTLQILGINDPVPGFGSLLTRSRITSEQVA